MCCRTPNHRQNRVITFSLVAVCCIWLGQLIVYSSNLSFFSFIIHHSHGNLIFNNQSESRALFKRFRLPCSFSWDISSSRLASFRLRKRQTFQNQVSWFNPEFSVIQWFNFAHLLNSRAHSYCSEKTMSLACKTCLNFMQIQVWIVVAWFHSCSWFQSFQKCNWIIT